MHFANSLLNVRDAAHRPGGDHRVDAAIIQRKSSGVIAIRLADCAVGDAKRPVRDDWTCTIRRDTAAWPGYIAEQLFASTLVPVCTPELATGLRKPSVIGWHGPARQPKPGGVREPCATERSFAPGRSGPSREPRKVPVTA